MTQTAAQIEYNIYTYELPAGQKKGKAKWKLTQTLSDMNDAMKAAENLHGSKKFQKVEVKQKFFDEKKNRTVDMTLKSFELKPDSNIGLYIALFGSVFAGVLAFAATYLLTGGGS
ncbi:MAG: hypothetical protein AAF569_02675 [Pseudomonadota bacterium]